MNPTPEQKLAIEEEGRNIIVSAGAGSGKTAVLSERVLKKVLNGVDVDRLLILTFTKAAAAEMKERIRKKIKKSGLNNQVNKIDNSYITTFDSFSLSLVKKYHYLLNIKKNVNIIESNVLKIKTKEYLDEIMEEKYQEKSANFVKLIDDFCVKDDYQIKNTIISLNDKLNLKYDKKEYLQHYIDYFYSNDVINKNILAYEKMLQDKIGELNLLLTKLSNVSDADYFSKVIMLCDNLLNSTCYDDIRMHSLNIKLPILRGADEEATKIKKAITELIKEIKSLTEIESVEKLRETILLTKPYLEELIDIINRLDQKLEKYKYENDLYDFVDISKMAIKIVKENESIREEIKNFFLEIMVDEYQDTSDLQEEFITLISNNNLYMVGDVKQSIYRFRNANPNIFRSKYNNYAKNSGGMKIDLLKNFRSREEVLANVNLIFDYIMSDEIGGANYIQEHRMIFGNTAYNVEGKTSQNNDFEVYCYDYDKKGEFKPDEIEAFIISDDIIKKVEGHYQIFDKDTKILRDITYNDFVILVDRSSSFELYKKVFLYKQIPLSIEKDEYLTNSAIFSCIKSIFKMLSLLTSESSKKEIEYCFLSIGRSFLCNYSDSYLFEVIKNNAYEETDIFKSLRKIIINIEDKTISNILDEIILEFNLYEQLRTISSLNDNYTKIDYLYTLSETLNSMGYNYHDFVNFIDNIFDNGNEIRFPVNKEDGTSVRIMTIHKSKGLEYPICYFPGLSKAFNTSDVKERINFSNELGIITPYYEEGMANNFIYELYKKNYYNEEISEKIRLFYVALTRAKEKMIFILQNKSQDEEYDDAGIVSQSIRSKYKSFADILYSINSKIKPYERSIDIQTLHLTKDYNLINSKNLFSEIKSQREKIELVNIPKIAKIKKELSHFSKSNINLISKKEKDLMEFGTMMHYYLETLNLISPDFTGIEDKYVVKIKKFLDSDLVKDIKKARIYQEYEFIYEEDNNIMHGVIDLMLEYHDHIDIIDYKLKNIDDDAYIKQLTGYKKNIESMKRVPVNIYLYSIMDEVYKKL